jgi:hypothetical protein
VGALGIATVVNLNLFDAGRGAAVGRETVQVHQAEELGKALPPAVRRLMARVSGAGAGAAGATDGTDVGPSALLVAGGVTAGLGVVVAAGAGAGAAVFSNIAATPTAPIDDKRAAIDNGRIALVGVGVGAVVVAVGVVVVVLGINGEQ